jgi:hypothetical protein
VNYVWADVQLEEKSYCAIEQRRSWFRVEEENKKVSKINSFFEKHWKESVVLAVIMTIVLLAIVLTPLNFLFTIVSLILVVSSCSFIAVGVLEIMQYGDVFDDDAIFPLIFGVICLLGTVFLIKFWMWLA